MDNDTSLKYPVVLVHGIVAHDRWKIINFWGRIPKILEEKGIQVFLGNTDSWGDCDSNARILKSTIEKILLETKTEKVNIIAHSKGGIDSRYLIWKHDFEDKIASLTTISTPHHGSELADLIYNQKIFHSKIAKKALDIFGKLYGDINPDLYNVNYQLTTNRMKEFNESIGINDKVYYKNMHNKFLLINNINGEILFNPGKVENNVISDRMKFLYNYLQDENPMNEEKAEQFSEEIMRIYEILDVVLNDFK